MPRTPDEVLLVTLRASESLVSKRFRYLEQPRSEVLLLDLKISRVRLGLLANGKKLPRTTSPVEFRRHGDLELVFGVLDRADANGSSLGHAGTVGKQVPVL